MEASTGKARVVIWAGITVVVAVATAIITGLLVNIFERKQEAKHTFVKLVELGEDDVDPAKWGINFPRQYDGYKRTSEVSSTKYGGAAATPEGGMAPQKAEKQGYLSRIFAGYLFAVDYRDRRGHAYMLQDQEVTKRNVPTEGKQSGNCLHCHASIMPLYRKLGGEALPDGTPAQKVQKGLEKVGELSYWDAHKQLEQTTGAAHPVSCIDCHDPKTMELRVTRPAFLNGIQALATSTEPLPHLPSVEKWRQGDRKLAYDPNVDGTRQEMRSYVCAQCHVEYFCGKGQTIFFPWAEGLKAEKIEQQYNALQVKGKRFKDWTHAETGMEVIKAQHPEFEVWSQGIHAKSGVACADCHMPYKREGAMKVSEHWVKSPLLEVNRSCGSCHPYPEQELKDRVETIQDRHFALMERAGTAATSMLDAIIAVRKPYDERHKEAALAKAKESLAKDPELAKLTDADKEKRLGAATKAALTASWQELVEKDPALKELGELQRAAQWRLDFVAAENSMGFHAPQELARLLGESIDLSRQAQVKATVLLAVPAQAQVAGGQ